MEAVSGGGGRQSIAEDLQMATIGNEHEALCGLGTSHADTMASTARWPHLPTLWSCALDPALPSFTRQPSASEILRRLIRNIVAWELLATSLSPPYVCAGSLTVFQTQVHQDLQGPAASVRVGPSVSKPILWPLSVSLLRSSQRFLTRPQ